MPATFRAFNLTYLSAGISLRFGRRVRQGKAADGNGRVGGREPERESERERVGSRSAAAAFAASFTLSAAAAAVARLLPLLAARANVRWTRLIRSEVNYICAPAAADARIGRDQLRLCAPPTVAPPPSIVHRVLGASFQPTAPSTSSTC